MNNSIMYTNNGSLEKHVRSKKVIPYMIYPNDVFKKGKWYYSLYYNNIFKILDLQYKNGELDNATIVTDDGNYGVISTDLDFQEDYAISRDRRNIYKMNIVNHEESFTGAEIIYWFFVNNIDIFNKKYQGFWKYVDRYSLDRVVDRERYFVKGLMVAGHYINCEIIKDISRKTYSKSDMKKDNKFMEELKEKDIHRIQELHKEEYL